MYRHINMREHFSWLFPSPTPKISLTFLISKMYYFEGNSRLLDSCFINSIFLTHHLWKWPYNILRLFVILQIQSLLCEIRVVPFTPGRLQMRKVAQFCFLQPCFTVAGLIMTMDWFLWFLLDMWILSTLEDSPPELRALQILINICLLFFCNR